MVCYDYCSDNEKGQRTTKWSNSSILSFLFFDSCFLFGAPWNRNHRQVKYDSYKTTIYQMSVKREVPNCSALMRHRSSGLKWANTPQIRTHFDLPAINFCERDFPTILQTVLWKRDKRWASSALPRKARVRHGLPVYVLTQREWRLMTCFCPSTVSGGSNLRISIKKKVSKGKKDAPASSILFSPNNPWIRTWVETTVCVVV